MLPVTNSGGTFLGIITLKDIIRLINANRKKLNFEEIKPSLTIKNTMEFEYGEGFDKQDIVPIVDENVLLIGFICNNDIIEFMNKRNNRIIERYNAILNSSYNGIIAIDNEGSIMIYNSAAERILNKKREDVIGKNISYIDPNKDLFEVVLTKKKKINIKNVINGYTIIANRAPLVYENENVGAVSVFLDISDLEKVSQDLDVTKTLSKNLNDIIESSHDGLYICDAEGIVTRVNSAWEKIAGFKRENIIGKYVKDLLNMGLYDNSAALQTLRNKTTTTTMIEIKSGVKNGQKIMATGTPLFNEGGKLTHVVVNVRDITELELLKLQLEKTKELNVHYANELEKARILHEESDDFIVNSPVMSKILESSLRVSRVDSSVLVTGESGVGKGALISKMHQYSRRSNEQLITVNCGAIPENLIESELFGYEEGAFTGAKKDGKIGMFELASGGTLFLDEIGDLPYNLQVKLLNAIQNKEIMRVGGIKPIKIDTRIISATNKDLKKMIGDGKFREDLFYRINVININIPPLRDRKEDIPKLILSIINKLNKKYGFNKSISVDAVECFIEYNWPGNIRELQNTLERLVVMLAEDVISYDNLPHYMKNEKTTTCFIEVNDILPLKDAIIQVERKTLQLAVDKYHSTRKIAKALEVNQSTIVRKLNLYNLSTDNE